MQCSDSGGKGCAYENTGLALAQLRTGLVLALWFRCNVCINHVRLVFRYRLQINVPRPIPTPSYTVKRGVFGPGGHFGPKVIFTYGSTGVPYKSINSFRFYGKQNGHAKGVII